MPTSAMFAAPINANTHFAYFIITNTLRHPHLLMACIVIELSDNEINEEGAIAFMLCLLVNKTVKNLALNEDNIGTKE